GYARADEIETLDREIAITDDPDRLAFGVFAVGDQLRPASDSPDRQRALLPDGDVSSIDAGLDFDGVAVARRGGSLGDRSHVAVRPDTDRSRFRIAGGRVAQPREREGETQDDRSEAERRCCRPHVFEGPPESTSRALGGSVGASAVDSVVAGREPARAVAL